MMSTLRINLLRAEVPIITKCIGIHFLCFHIFSVSGKRIK
jgi:hypothetical protein